MFFEGIEMGKPCWKREERRLESRDCREQNLLGSYRKAREGTDLRQ